MITTARQLKDLIRNMSKKKSADAQILNAELYDGTFFRTNFFIRV